MLDAKRIKELQETISESLIVYITAKESYLYTRYLHFPGTEEEREYLQHSQDFGYIRHVLWRNTVIELSKLISDSKGDKYSVVRLIMKFQPSGEYSQGNIPKEKLVEWAAFQINNTAQIQQVKMMRDKIYSHTDHPATRATVTGITFDEYKLILNFVEDIIRTVFAVTMDVGLSTETPIYDMGVFPGIIQVLATEKKARIDDILKGFKRKQS